MHSSGGLILNGGNNNEAIRNAVFTYVILKLVRMQEGVIDLAPVDYTAFDVDNDQVDAPFVAVHVVEGFHIIAV